MDSNITNIIFDFVGHISKVFEILPYECYNENKAKIININKYIINTNQDIITSTNEDTDGNIIYIELNNCIASRVRDQRTNLLHLKYIFRISPDLTNTVILNHLIEPEKENNNTCITFTYLNKSIVGYILNYDIKNHTITLQHEYARRFKNIANNGIEIFNIDMISKCELEYTINYFINNTLKSDEHDYNKRHYESNDTKIINNKKKYIKQPNNDNIDFID